MKLHKGLDDKIIDQISDVKGEPNWLRKFRHDCFRIYQKLEDPKDCPDLSGLKIDEALCYLEPKNGISHKWSDVPAEIRKSCESFNMDEVEKKDFTGIALQYNSEIAYHTLQDEAKNRGIVFLSIEDAAKSRKYGKIFREHFMKLVKPSDHKYAALHGALFSGGAFVYVPKGVCASFPLQSFCRLNAPSVGMFGHALIILEEDSALHYIEACSSSEHSEVNLHDACVEIFVGKNASVKYSAIENWSKNVYNLSTKRAIVAEGGKIEWVTGAFGSKVTMIYPSSYLTGRGASAEYTSVGFADKDQALDTGIKVFHEAPDTHSLIISKSIAKGGGINTFRGFATVLNEAHGTRSFTDCASLMLDNDSHTYTIPFFDVREEDASVAHEASVGNISEKEIEYLCSRGIDEDAARGLIVRGFANDVSKQLPAEYAMEMNKYLQLSMEGNL